TLGPAFSGILAYCAVGVVKLGVDLLHAQLFGPAVVREGKLHRRDGFIEEPNKRGPAGDRFLIEDLLLGLAQVVRPPGAFLVEIMTVAGQRWMLDQSTGRLVREFNPFQVEEDEVLIDGSPRLAGAREQGAAFRIIRLGGVD